MARTSKDILDELLTLLPARGITAKPHSALYQLLAVVASQLERHEQHIEALQLQLSTITPEKIAEAVWGANVPQTIDKKEVTKRIMERLEAPWKVTK